MEILDMQSLIGFMSRDRIFVCIWSTTPGIFVQNSATDIIDEFLC